VRATRPVFIGDTIHPEARLTSARTTSRPGVGLWTFAYEAVNQEGAVVMTFSGSFLVTARPGGAAAPAPSHQVPTSGPLR
jgi:itaconyl-CoA hydratase